MSQSVSFLMIFLFLAVSRLNAQTVFVDAVKGKDGAKGTVTDPIANLEQAMRQANSFSGNEPVTIRLYPGLYTLQQQVEIKTAKPADDTIKYTIEAVVMPDDPEWKPASMPVIQSVSPDNSTTQFVHAVGFLVGKNGQQETCREKINSFHNRYLYLFFVGFKNSCLQLIAV